MKLVLEVIKKAKKWYLLRMRDTIKNTLRGSFQMKVSKTMKKKNVWKYVSEILKQQLKNPSLHGTKADDKENCQHEHHIPPIKELQILINRSNTSHCHHQSETTYPKTYRSVRNMSVTPGKAEELECVHNRFNSIITFSLSVTKYFSYIIWLFLCKMSWFRNGIF